MSEAKMEVLFLEGGQGRRGFGFFCGKILWIPTDFVGSCVGVCIFSPVATWSGVPYGIHRKLGCRCSFYLDGCELRASVPMRGFLFLNVAFDADKVFLSGDVWKFFVGFFCFLQSEL